MPIHVDVTKERTEELFLQTKTAIDSFGERECLPDSRAGATEREGGRKRVPAQFPSDEREAHMAV